MKILAIDTSDQVLSVALETDAGIFLSETDAGMKHSELLMESVDALCKTAGLNQGELEYVACMKGPGSFTGLRIGFSAAKGLCLALGIPLLTAPTLDCAAYPHSIWPGMVLPVIDAKKGCFFTALYRGGRQLTGYMDAAPDLIAQSLNSASSFTEEPLLLTGSGAYLFKPLLEKLFPVGRIRLDPEYRKGRAMELLNIIKKDILLKEDELHSGPMYLRKSDAEINQKLP